MKIMSLIAVLTLSLATSMANADQAGDLRQGEVEGIAQIIDVRDDQMFPVRTLTLSAMVSCGARILGGYSKDLGNDNVEVGVRLAYQPTGGMCLAMPTRHEIEVQVNSMTPVNITVNGLAIPL